MRANCPSTKAAEMSNSRTLELTPKMVFFLNVPSLVWLYVGNQKQKIITKYK